MMRRGPLADNPIEALLAQAAQERANGILELHSVLDGLVFLVDGEIYLAELAGQPPLDERLVAAGLLTESQVRDHGVPAEGGVYLARALDTDVSIDEDAIDDYLLDTTAATIARFVGITEGEYELDPYGAHVAGVLSSWTPDTVFERVEVLRNEAARIEVERAEAERVAAEQAQAEREEAERQEAERLAEIRKEAERVEAEAEAEAAAAEEAARESAEPDRDPVDTGVTVAESGDVEHVADEAAKPSEIDESEADADAPVDLPEDGEAAEDDAIEDLSHLPAPPTPSDSDTADAVVEVPKSQPSADALVANAVPIADRKPGGLGAIGPGVLLVVPDEPPDEAASIELTPVEWKVVVLAAQGDSLGGIAGRLDLDLDQAREVVDRLWCRGLVATIGPGGPVTG